MVKGEGSRRVVKGDENMKDWEDQVGRMTEGEQGKRYGELLWD